jgi:hypothetical protein
MDTLRIHGVGNDLGGDLCALGAGDAGSHQLGLCSALSTVTFPLFLVIYYFTIFFFFFTKSKVVYSPITMT